MVAKTVKPEELVQEYLEQLPTRERYAPLITLAKKVIFGTVGVVVFLFMFIMAFSPSPSNAASTVPVPIPISTACDGVTFGKTIDLNRDGFIDCRSKDETGSRP